MENEKFDRYYTTSVDDKIVSQGGVRFDRNPQNIRELVQGLVKLVPEVHDRFEEVYALIKTHGHLEKYLTWQTVKEFTNKDDYIHDVALEKMETHNTENWRDFDKNLEWAKQHQSRDTRVIINGETAYLRNSNRKSTYQEVVEKAFGKEYDGTVYSVTYRNKKTKAEGILGYEKSIEVDEDTIFNAAFTGNA